MNFSDVEKLQFAEPLLAVAFVTHSNPFVVPKFKIVQISQYPILKSSKH